MRESFAAILRCPSCRSAGRFEIRGAVSDEREIREGELACEVCGATRRVRDGVVEAMDGAPDYVTREAAGLERFAALMRSDGWDRERILELPYVKHGYWYAQAVAMQQVLAGGAPGITLAPGERLLDVGSNTCWASAAFAARGLEVVALDIALHEMQGLRTADWWFEDRDVYFERILSVMFDPALADESFDLVWCCEVLHHNHRANLERTMRELFRLLRPGGRVIVVNEPVRALLSPKLRPGSDVAEYEGHEHAYLRRSYVAAARDAGFDVRLFGPQRFGALADETLGVSMRMTTLEGFKVAFTHGLRRNRPLRAAYLAFQNYVRGVSLQMVAAKPASDRVEVPDAVDRVEAL